MDLHEYQSKSILRKYGVAVPEGVLAQTEAEAVKAAEYLSSITGTDKWVVKAQVHAGGRGKGGGMRGAGTRVGGQLIACCGMEERQAPWSCG